MLRKRILFGATALLGLTLVFAADEVDVSKLPPAAGKTVDFEKDVKPILEKSCIKCHSGAKPKSSYSMESRESTIKGGSSEAAAVVEGKSDKSPLIHFVSDLVTDMEMPPVDKRDKYPALTKDQVGVLRAWIDQGAKWPDGVKLSVPQ